MQELICVSQSSAASCRSTARAIGAAPLIETPPGFEYRRVSGSASHEWSTPTQLDLEVMRSARMAGIPDQIAEMARLASMGRPKLADFPTSQRRKQSANVPSESEEEEVGVPDADPLQDGSSAPTGADATITQAVTKLTRSQLTSLLRKSRRAWTLKTVLVREAVERVQQFLAIASTPLLMRALQKTLHAKPEEIYKLMEHSISEHFQLQAQLPGSAFATPVRFLWAVAGIHDCLQADRVAEARARCMLLLAQGDRLSIDRGSWVVASELALHGTSPATGVIRSAHLADGVRASSHAADRRPVVRCLPFQKLQDYDNLSEKKKKLGTKRSSQAPSSAASSEPQTSCGIHSQDGSYRD